MSTLLTTMRHLLLGRPARVDSSASGSISSTRALPVLGANMLSSVAYAPGEIIVTAAAAGVSGLAFAPWVAVAVAALMLVVFASYRYNVHAYPEGDYQAVSANLGDRAGVVIGSALLVDHILTVAVAAAAAAASFGSVQPTIGAHPVWTAVTISVLVGLIHLRAHRQRHLVASVIVYVFVVAILGTIVVGLVSYAAGATLRAPSSGYGFDTGGDLAGLALVLVLLRSFASGSVALSGVEVIPHRVAQFEPPRARRATRTLLLVVLLSATMVVGITALATIARVRLSGLGVGLIGTPDGYVQQTALVQVADAVFPDFPAGYYLVAVITGLALMVACITALRSFPLLASRLAHDEYLPRQLAVRRGRRGRWGSGSRSLVLTVVVVLLLIVFRADVTLLIGVYMVGVFASLTGAQIAMVRHWSLRLRGRSASGATAGRPPGTAAVGQRPPGRAGSSGRADSSGRMRVALVINLVGALITAVVLLVVIVTKFTDGAWVAIAVMVLLIFVMQGIRRHYRRVADELAGFERDLVLPSRVHGIVLVSRLHLPAMRALGYARATRPDVLEAVTINVDAAVTADLAREWEDRQIPVPLKIIDSPTPEITKPVLDYVRRVRRESPRDVVTVFIPEYVVQHWWEQLLHNQSALRLKGRLLFTPGVMVTSVPWQIGAPDPEGPEPSPTEGDDPAEVEVTAERTGWFGQALPDDGPSPGGRSRRRRRRGRREDPR